jgi:hypothetical protein
VATIKDKVACSKILTTDSVIACLIVCNVRQTAQRELTRQPICRSARAGYCYTRAILNSPEVLHREAAHDAVRALLRRDVPLPRQHARRAAPHASVHRPLVAIEMRDEVRRHLGAHAFLRSIADIQLFFSSEFRRTASAWASQ